VLQSWFVVLLQTVSGEEFPEMRMGVLAELLVGNPKKLRKVATSLGTMSLVPAMAIVCPAPSRPAFHKGRML
jgi:hypothetical protein